MLVNSFTELSSQFLFRVLLSVPYLLLAVYTCMSGILYLKTKSLRECEPYFMKAFWAFMSVIALLLCLFLSSNQDAFLFSSHLFFSLYFTGLFGCCLIKPNLSYYRKLLLLAILPFSLLICFFIL